MLQDIYRRRPEAVGFSCYIWNISFVRELIADLALVLPKTEIWLGGPEVSFECETLLHSLPAVRGVMKGEGEETFCRLAAAYGEAERPVSYTHLLGQSKNPTLCTAANRTANVAECRTATSAGKNKG